MDKRDTDIQQLIIIGSGPAGLTAAIYASRANLKPIIIDGTLPGGQLMKTTFVENWPGEKSILGPTLMSNMREHAKHFGTTFISQEIVSVDFKNRPFSVTTKKGTVYRAHAIIVATGATPKRLGCPGEDEYWGKGVTTCAVCDGAFYAGKKVLIVGGGDTAMEDASFLKKFTSDITIVHILDKFTASHAMQQRVLNDPTIKVIYNSTVTQINGNGDHVTEVTITNQATNTTETMAVDGVFIAVGLSPNTACFVGQLPLNKWGYAEVIDEVKTNIEGVFVAGDVHDFRYRQAITAAGAGCMAALEASRYLEALEAEHQNQK